LPLSGNITSHTYGLPFFSKILLLKKRTNYKYLLKNENVIVDLNKA